MMAAAVALDTPPLYRLRGVERRYMKGASEVAAVRGVDLDIASGGFVCIEGPSGSGKSTLLQLLGALDTPTAGTIQMDDQELGTAGDHVLTEIRSKRIGFVFQHFNLIPTLSALENVALAMAPHHGSRAQRDERAKQLLTRVGLGHRLEHLPSRLSGGEQQRVAIARALANRPDVIVADEPTGNLDSESAAEVMSLLVELQQRDGVTVIVATHDPEVAQHREPSHQPSRWCGRGRHRSVAGRAPSITTDPECTSIEMRSGTAPLRVRRALGAWSRHLHMMPLGAGRLRILNPEDPGWNRGDSTRSATLFRADLDL